MRVRILAVGHKPASWVTQACEDYLKRFSKGISVEIVDVKPGVRSKQTAKDEAAQAIEKDRLLTNTQKNSMLIALDEKGKSVTTKELAGMLDDWMSSGDNIDICIGGADGLHPEVKQQASKILSLSSMTLPHAFVRLLIVEQLYRAHCINLNHPYHRE
ncbi:MAG: 23S rRNA (pseudouridine(1915)-N(3))-methyltransferase RlmH [Burkholderiales bacterium]|jgi:23S rRNA (pseudouridine1915-N3)-methyltransferase